MKVGGTGCLIEYSCQTVFTCECGVQTSTHSNGKEAVCPSCRKLLIFKDMLDPRCSTNTQESQS